MDQGAGATYAVASDMVIELSGLKNLAGSAIGDHIVTLAVA
jgi:hypothetical protein